MNNSNFNFLQHLKTLNTNNFGAIIEESYKFLSLIIANKFKQDAIIVAKNNNELYYIHNLANLLTKNLNIFLYPEFNTDFYQNVSPHKSILAQRINTLFSLYENKTDPKIVITTTKALLQKTLAPQYLQNRKLTLHIKQNIKQESIISFLINNNYFKVATVMESGQFAVRGDIIDIYPPNEAPFRIDFFDDTIEKIKTIDIYSQKSVNPLEEVILLPSSELILNKNNNENLQYNYQTLFGHKNKTLFELLDANILPKGIENYLALFYENTATIIDYLNKPIIISFKNINELAQEIINHYKQEYEYSLNSTFRKEKPDILPIEYILQSQEYLQKYNNKYFSLNKESLINTQLFSPLFTPYKHKKNNYINAIISFIKDNPGNKYIILANNPAFIDLLKVELAKNNIDYNTKIDNANTVIILLDPNHSLAEGFIIENYYIISESDITGHKQTFSLSKKPKKNINLITTLEINDIVAHIKHGLGLYKGLTTLKANKIEHDFLEVEYRNAEKLYIPVENMDLLSKYSSENENIILDKLGSNNFEAKQFKIKQKIHNIAHDLIKIAANRNLNQAIPININTQEYENFCEEFPYVETDDQIKAINDIVEDFLSGKVADRLICGDVGFGKTEVAMRAAFMIANSGFQVALIAPTTLLCNQHYINFSKRFASTAIKVEELSRFVANKKKKEIKEELKKGNIDIIIATHALLAKDVTFKNIGLVIIDEEQNFGVVHKEKLKALKENTHIITLSATPIPRTIELAFKGIKDLSIIATPPVEKLPISTYILPLDLITIKNAIHNEIERKGQVYFVCSKIRELEDIKKIIDSLGINLTYTVIHGQLPTDVIEQNMLDFQSGKYDILISTNIIESGLDLKNVNTIIIYKSYNFGLAQLYQLRGRVGRSNTKSYAYLLYDKHLPLTSQAEKRLQVLQSLDYLGASFALASYDLELRGSGNLLGEEQSGHIKEIGFDLYQKLLEQEMKYIKKQNNKGDYDYATDYFSFSPNISLHLPSFIPKRYINDTETSILMYQRLANIKSISELEEIKDEMIDRFGKFPAEVENFLLTIRLKIASKNAYVEKIDLGSKTALLYFYQSSFPKPDKLINYIQNTSGFSFKPNNVIAYQFSETDIYKQIDEILIILFKLNSLLKEK